MHRTLLRRAFSMLPICVLASSAAALGPATRPDNSLESVFPDVVRGGRLPPLPLGKPFDRESAGITFRAPEGYTPIIELDREEIVRFVNDLKKPTWTLSLTRKSFPKGPQVLFGVKDAKGEFVNGIVENTLLALKGELSGKVLRAGDPTNIGTKDVGMIVMRYTKNGERRLAQHAIIEANDQLYYLLAFNSPARKDQVEDANVEEKTSDPVEQQAVETFRAILDTVKLLDLGPLRADQTQRLFKTRTLFYNLTERKLTETLIPEQYQRILRDGRDVGYSYVVEQVDRKGGADGIRIGNRTRIMTRFEGERPDAEALMAATTHPTTRPLPTGKLLPYPRQDSESWMFSSMDRKKEDWSKINVWDDGQEKTPQNPWKKVSEMGTSLFETRNFIKDLPKDPNDPLSINKRPSFQRGDEDDPHNPWVEKRDKYTLTVQFKATRGDLQPVIRQLPPFYLPQAHTTLLPRLLPPREVKSYMFATYSSELRQVMLRYVDVGAETDLPVEVSRGAAGAKGVPITDRLGVDGPPTTHWVTQKGVWLGSVTKGNGITVLPVDEQTLKQLWNINDSIKLPDLPGSGSADPASLPSPAAPSTFGPQLPKPRPR